MPAKVMIPDELAETLRSEGKQWGRSLRQEVLYRLNTWPNQVPNVALKGTNQVPPETVGTNHGPERYQTGTKQVPEMAQTGTIHGPNVAQTGTTDEIDDEDEDEPQTPADRAWLLDLLLADGDPKRPNSNFQVRRKRQTEFLRTQWQEMFDKPVPDATLKQFLQLSGDSSQAVLEAMEVAAGRGVTGNGTVNYVKKVLTTRAEKAKQPPMPEKPVEGKHPWDTAPTLREPTAEDYAEWERAERLWELTESGDNT